MRGNNNHKVLNYDSATNQECGITSISISPNNRYVAGGCLDGFVRVWSVDSGEMVTKLRGHSDSVYAVRFAPDGLTLISGSLDYTVKYWDVSPLFSRDAQLPLVPCSLIGSLKGHQVRIFCVTNNI